MVGAAVVVPAAGLELARGAPARVRGPAGAVLLVGGRVVGRRFGSAAKSGHEEQRHDGELMNKVLTFASFLSIRNESYSATAHYAGYVYCYADAAGLRCRGTFGRGTFGRWTFGRGTFGSGTLTVEFWGSPHSGGWASSSDTTYISNRAI